MDYSNGVQDFKPSMSAAGSPAQLLASNGKKRKRVSIGERSETPESHDEIAGAPKARRACNECRQQKVLPLS